MTVPVSFEAHDKYVVISIRNGKANVISHEVIDLINAHLDTAEKDGAVVVLTGTSGMFSGGYDLSVMRESMELAMKLVEKGSTLSKRLLSFPTPVIAACEGHAVAKGAFLLLSADYRIGLKGDFKIGLNEVAIGMTMHNAGVELARARLTPSYFNRSVINAEIFNPKSAIDAGFLDLVVKPKKFGKAVKAVAEAMSSLDMKAHRQTKLRARAGLLEVLEKSIESDRNGSL